MFVIFTKIADWFTYSILRLDSTTRLGAALHFFVEDILKIYFLLVTMIYIIAFLRAALDVQRIRRFLAGKNRLLGYALASMFGAVTPFCSCSSIPLFLGFTAARIPLGITMAFMITSPMINEVAVILLGSLLGLKFTVFYVLTGMAAGILGGFLLDLIGAEKYLTAIGQKALAVDAADGTDAKLRLSMRRRHEFAVTELKEIFSRVWKWVLIGVGLGAVLHGFVPQDFIVSNLGNKQWWSVPLAVLLGIPLYANASGIIPVAESLLLKGLPIGTTLAFMMSVTAVSFPEFMMLSRVMKPRLLFLFFIILLVFFTAAGWIFNLFF